MDAAALKEEILRLKQEKGVLILAHNYVIGDIQDIADVVADSLVLARKARDASEDKILFCGVDFMAESALILSPDKTVVHPTPESKCPMAAMATKDEVVEFKKKHPGVPVVAYVNTTAELKTVVDVCCTSANAVKVVKALGTDKVIFVPDCNLGQYIQTQVPEVEVILWEGHCHVHNDVGALDVMTMMSRYPDAVVMAHPECKPEVLKLADGIFSTEGMVKHAQASDAKQFIVITEEGLTYRMKKLMPEKEFIPLQTAVCHNMKRITLEVVLESLRTMEPKVKLPEDVIRDAKKALDRMVQIV